MERTLVLIKPDGVQRGLVGEIIQRFERKGLRVIGIKLMRVSQELARTHYKDHVEKPFYPSLEKFITSGPIVAMVWEGSNAIEKVRTMMGATNPDKAVPGTIRGDYAQQTGPNLVHGSDGTESAAREIGIFFQESELFDWERSIDQWVFEE